MRIVGQLERTVDDVMASPYPVLKLRKNARPMRLLVERDAVVRGFYSSEC